LDRWSKYQYDALANVGYVMDRVDPPGLPKTDWALVEKAGGAPSVSQREAIQILVRRYIPALRAHLAATFGANGHRADDLLQEFLSVKIVEQRLIGRAKRERGKFRNFLRKTLDDFVISEIRKEKRKKRSPGKLSGLDDASESDPHAGTPPHAFELAWAREVLAEAVEGMSEECRRSKRPDLWGIFQGRVLRPALDGTPPLDYDLLVKRFEFDSPTQAANALTTAKRMLERHLRAVLRQYSVDEREVDESILEIRAILARPR
jgi:DNA-directed RNA polymerase specialized sigma24 family protein